MSLPPNPLSSGQPTAFAIAAPPSVELSGQNTGTTSIAVTNLTGRPVRARIVPRGANGAADEWFAVVGPPEVPLAVGATATVTVGITVPAGTPRGDHLLRVDVVAEDDTESVTGQSVAFSVRGPVAAGGGKFPWLAVILIVVVLLLLGGGAAAYFLLRSPAAPEPSDSPPRVPASSSAGARPVENNRAPTISGETSIGAALTLMDKGSWSEGDLTFAVQWQRCEGDDCSDIDGATGDSYTTVEADDQHTVRAHVTVTTAQGGTGGADSNQLGPFAWPEGACIDGFVWRLVNDADHVCVTEQVHQDVLDDNAEKESRWVQGNFGAHTCISGYVWRAAVDGDDVCVIPERRSQAAQDNAEAASRVRPR